MYIKLYRHENKYAEVPILIELNFSATLGKLKDSDKYVDCGEAAGLLIN
jgi:hypothetical protein